VCVRRRLWLFLAAFLVYNLNLRPIPAGDTSPAALLPFAILADHTLTFDRFAAWHEQSQQMVPVWFTRGRDGHFYSAYPIALPLLLTPLYAPLVASLDIEQMPVGRLVLLARVLEKFSASLIAALSVIAFLALAESLSGWRAACQASLVYAFASQTWSTASQALWQHGASEFAIILTLLCLVKTRKRPASYLPVALFGMCAGLTFAFRPSNGIFVCLCGVYALLSCWRPAQKAVFACSGGVVVLASVAYSWRVFGSPLGGYSGEMQFDANPLIGLAGLLISPSRGLFVFSPVFIFSAVGIYIWWRGGRTFYPDVYWICLVFSASHIGAMSMWRMWYGGFNYGPRLLTDIVPCLVILMIPSIVWISRSTAWKLAFAVMLAVSIGVQAVGTFCYPNGHWDALPQPVDQHQERLWDWRDSQILRSAEAGPVLLPYRLAWSFVTHGAIDEKLLNRENVKLW
jgi:hypothetical protein